MSSQRVRGFEYRYSYCCIKDIANPRRHCLQQTPSTVYDDTVYSSYKGILLDTELSIGLGLVSLEKMALL
jgi:hypothetical protein